MKISKILWIIPFLSFISGYLVLNFFLQKKEILTPNVVGKDLQTGINILSEQKLGLRLLRQQEDSDFPDGIILDQHPKGAQKIKTGQHVFVVISKKPKPITTPDFIGQNSKNISFMSSKMGIPTKIFWINSNYPVNTCIAQYPTPGSNFTTDQLITYLSNGNSKEYIIPNFKNCPVLKIKEICEKENIKIEVVHNKQVEPTHSCQNCVVTDQKPIPGSIIDLSKKLYMQVLCDQPK